jgi:hypothetical protein
MRESGRSDGGPERSVLVFGIFERAEDCTPGGWVPPSAVDSSPHALVGEPSRVVDTLCERRQRYGLSYYVCFDYELDRMEPPPRGSALSAADENHCRGAPPSVQRGGSQFCFSHRWQLHRGRAGILFARADLPERSGSIRHF